jgi:hypothetical protein
MERGPAEMRLDQALDLLRGKPGSIERLGPDFVQRARAAALIGDAVRNGSLQSTPLWPTHDARRADDAARAVRTYDAATQHDVPHKGGRKMHIHVHGLTRDDNGDLVEAGDAGTNGAQNVPRLAGSKLVQRLPGGLTDYFISAIPDDPDGGVGLYQVASANNVVDPGAISIKSKTLNADQKRAVARDARRSFSLLAGINRKNAAFWAGK